MRTRYVRQPGRFIRHDLTVVHVLAHDMVEINGLLEAVHLRLLTITDRPCRNCSLLSFHYAVPIQEECYMNNRQGRMG